MIFHDRFVTCAWNYIERQKALEAGEEVPEMTSPFKDSISILKLVPIGDYGVNLASFFADLWNGRFFAFANIDLDSLFPYEKRIMKQILSEAIQEVAINFEEKLCKSKTRKEISAYANAAVLKFLNSLKNYGSKSEEAMTAQDISIAILEQNSYFTDIFNCRPKKSSENYKFIYEADLKEYLEHINQDSEYTERDLVESPNIPISLSKFLREKHENPSRIQIVLRGEVAIRIRKKLNLDYENLNGYEFETEDETIELSRVKAKLAKMTQPEEQRLRKAQEINLVQISQVTDEIYFYNIIGEAPSFVGRKREINKLHENSFHHKTQVVVGDAGVGKTQIVLKYITKYKSEYNYRVRLFSASSEEYLKISFRKFAQELGIETINLRDEEVFKLVNKKLATQIQKTLFIFDDVENPEHIAKYFDALNSIDRHHVFIITRNRIADWTVFVPNDYIIDINPISIEDAIEYIKKNIPSAKQEDVIELAYLFDNIPLALFQGVKYIRHTSSDIKEYIEEFKSILENTGDFENLIQNNHITSIYSKSLSIVVNELSYIPKAIEILKILSYLHTDSIPEFIFNSLFETTKDKNDAIKVLSAYSLINIRLENEAKLIYINSLVQELVRREYGSLEVLHISINLVNNKMADFSLGVDAVLKANQPLEKHALALIKHVRNINRNLDIKLEFAELNIHCGKLFFAQGELNKASVYYNYSKNELIPIASEQVIITREQFHKSQLLLAETHQNCGNTFEKLSRHGESLEEYEQALRLRNSIFGEMSLQSARTIYAIGCVKCKQGNYLIALEQFKRALLNVVSPQELVDNLINSVATEGDISRFLQFTGDELKKHLSAKIFDAIGTTYKELEQYKKALVQYKLSSRINIETDLDQHLNFVMLNKYHLGEIYLLLREYNNAKDILEESLTFYQQKHLHKDHIEIAMSLNNIGDYFTHTLQYKEALTYYKKSLTMKEKYEDQYIDYIAVTYGSMAQSYFRLSMNHEALISYEKCLKIKSNIHLNEPSHKDIIYLKNAVKLVEISRFIAIPFIVKEVLESKSTLKYLFIEIIHIQKFFPILEHIEIPEWIDNSYFLILIHFLSSYSGLYLIDSKHITPGKLEVVLTSNFAFGLKLLTHKYFIDYELFNNKKYKQISSITEFFYECSGDIANSALFSSINLFFNSAIPVLSAPMAFDIGIMTMFSGVSCYASSIPNENKVESENKYWPISYTMDFLVGCLALTKMNFKLALEASENNKIMMSIALTKQVLILVNTIVLVDYTSKILISMNQKQIDDFVESPFKTLDTIKGNIVNKINFLGEMNLFSYEDDFKDEA